MRPKSAFCVPNGLWIRKSPVTLVPEPKMILRKRKGKDENTQSTHATPPTQANEPVSTSVQSRTPSEDQTKKHKKNTATLESTSSASAGHDGGVGEEFAKVFQAAKQSRADFKAFKAKYDGASKHKEAFRKGSQVPINSIHQCRLSHKIISYSPIQKGAFPDPKESFLIRSNTITCFTDMADDFLVSRLHRAKYPKGKLLVCGPLGIGKSVAMVLDALERRQSPECRIVLISNPEHVSQSPKALLNELIYAFADESLPDDFASKEFTDHPMGSIRKFFMDNNLDDYKSCVTALKALLGELRTKCGKLGQQLILFLDQYDSLWTASNDTKRGATFIREEILTYFHKVIAMASSNSELLLGKSQEGFSLRSIANTIDDIDRAFFIKAYLNISEDLDEDDIHSVEGLAGNNYGDLLEVLRSPGNDITEKISSSCDGFHEKIMEATAKHRIWFQQYRQTKRDDLKTYFALHQFIFSKEPLTKTFNTTMLAFDPYRSFVPSLLMLSDRPIILPQLLPYFDIRFFSIDERTKTFVAASAVAEKVYGAMMSEAFFSHNKEIMAMLS